MSPAIAESSPRGAATPCQCAGVCTSRSKPLGYTGWRSSMNARGAAAAGGPVGK